VEIERRDLQASRLKTEDLWCQGWASECRDVKNYTWRLNPDWHRMLFCVSIARQPGFIVCHGGSCTPSLNSVSLNSARWRYSLHLTYTVSI